MKDELIYWYFRLRDLLVVMAALLILAIGLYLLVFQTALLMNIIIVVIGAFIVVMFLSFVFVGLWAVIDKLLPSDPRKSKDGDA